MFDVPDTEFTLMGDWDASPEPADRVVLRLHPDNGQTFNFADASTIAMLQAMEQADLVGKSVLDFGTGSGILAVAAEKLGAMHIVVTDHNSVAMEAAFATQQANRTTASMTEYDPGDHYDVILANVGDGDLVATLINRCDLLIASVPKGRKRLASGRNVRPVYAKGAEDLAKVRPMTVTDFDDEWSVVVG